MMKQVKVEIDTDGSISIEAQGYEGNSCREATEWLETELGLTSEQKLKPEYYRQARIQQQGRLCHGRRNDL